MPHALKTGVSAYVTIVLLILITLAVSVAFYYFIIGYEGRHEPVGRTSALVIENVFRGDPNIPLLLISVRNEGSSPARLDTVYVITASGTLRYAVGPYTVPAGSSRMIAVLTNLKPSQAFRVEVSGPSGTASSPSGLTLSALPTLEVFRRSVVTITERSGSNLVNYAVHVMLTPSWGGWRYVSAGGSDIFFLTKSGKPLYYWIEYFDPVAKEASIWVKIPYIPALSKVEVLMYYGYSEYLSSNPYSTYDDPYRVFTYFYDGFEVWSGWSQYLYGEVLQSSTYSFTGTYSLEKTAACDPSGGLKALPTTLGSGWALEAWVYRATNPIGCSWDRIGVVNSAGYGYGVGVYTGIPAPGTTTPGTPSIWIDVRAGYYAQARLGVVYGTTPFYRRWYFVRLWRVGSTLNATAYTTGWVKIFSTEATSSTYTTFTYVYVFGGYTYYVDDLRVRPYVNPEPLVSVSG